MANDDKHFLVSKRLGFRRWREGDLEIAGELWGDPEVTKLFDARGKWSQAEVEARLVNEIRTEKKYGVQYWPAFLRTDGGFVGCCGLRPYDPAGGIYEIGFHIRSNLWRRGYAREAAVAVIRHAFSVVKVNGLFAGHNPENYASRRLLEQLGFRYTHDEYYGPTGLNHPSYVLRAHDLPPDKFGKVV